MGGEVASRPAPDAEPDQWTDYFYFPQQRRGESLASGGITATGAASGSWPSVTPLSTRSQETYWPVTDVQTKH